MFPKPAEQARGYHFPANPTLTLTATGVLGAIGFLCGFASLGNGKLQLGS